MFFLVWQPPELATGHMAMIFSHDRVSAIAVRSYGPDAQHNNQPMLVI